MSGDLDVPRSTCYPARHLASAAMEEGIRRTQQQSVPPQVPQVGRAAGETGASPSIRRPMLVASVAEAKKPSRGILQWLAPSLIGPANLAPVGVEQSGQSGDLCVQQTKGAPEPRQDGAGQATAEQSQRLARACV